MHADDVAAYVGPFWRLKEVMGYYEWERQETERRSKAAKPSEPT
jgi:hypothetical protein